MRNPDDTMGSVELPKVPEIVSQAEAVWVEKDDGTKVGYYIFPEFEVHANTLPAGVVQGWHYHKLIEEVIFVTDGQIEVRWRDEAGNEDAKVLKSGDLCRLGRSIHTVVNSGSSAANFLVYRLVPLGKNQHELIKGDRYAR